MKSKKGKTSKKANSLDLGKTLGIGSSSVSSDACSTAIGGYPPWFLMSEEEVCKALQISRCTLWKIRNGKVKDALPLKFIKLGTSIKYNPKDVQQWIKDMSGR